MEEKVIITVVTVNGGSYEKEVDVEELDKVFDSLSDNNPAVWVNNNESTGR